MGRRGNQRRNEDTFPYLLLLGVIVVALVAGILIGGVQVHPPTENVAGQAFVNPNEQVEVCGKTIYLDGPGNHKELYSRTGTGTPVRISEPLLADGQVYKFTITPDGQYALYLARGTVANPQPTVNLYRVSINGGEALRLNNPLPDNTQVNDVAVSPDSQYIAYTADLGQVGGHTQFDLYTVPITGGVATRRTTVAIQNDVWPGIIFTPDSQRIVYATHNTVSGDAGLYSAARASGSSITLVDPEERVDRNEFAVSCDSQIAYFFTDPVGSSRHLYSIPILGGASTQLTGTELPTLNCPAPPLPTCGNTNTGTPSVFIDDRDTPNKNELYSENAATGVITKISAAIPNDEDVTSFQITTDGQRVVYRVGKQFAEGTYTGGNWQLYSVPTTGGTAVRISGPMQPQGGVGLFRVAPDGTRVAYTADATNNTAQELYSVPILGGAVSSLSGPMRVYFDSPSLITSNVISLFISPDSQRVVYSADMESWTMYEAYSVPITGGVKTRINHVLPADHDVEGIVIAPNSQRVVYRAVRTSLGKGELYSVPITGGTAVRISQPWNPPTSTIDVEFDANGLGAVVSCDSQTVYYLADTIGDGSRDELYSTPIVGGAITPLTGSALPTFTCATNNTNACFAIGAVCTTNSNCCSNACSNSHCVSLNPNSGNSSAPAGFAPASDPIDGTAYLVASTSASGVQVSANSNNGRYTWRHGYYLKNNQWTRFTFPNPGLANTNWTNGTLTVTLPADAPDNGYVIIYACKKYPGREGFICGPRTATQTASERYWTIVEYGANGGGGDGCTDECSAGATICSGTTGYRTCGNHDSDSCREWSTTTSCTGSQTCSNGACTTGGGGGGGGGTYCNSIDRAVCSTSAVTGATQVTATCPACTISPCPPNPEPRHCYQCPAEQTPVYTAATNSYSCSGSTGGGGDPCTNDCATGETRCSGTQVQVCGNTDTDTCLDWGAPSACPTAGQTCQGTACAPTGGGGTSECPTWWVRRCNPTSTAVQVCTDYDNNGQFTWTTENTCTGAQSCIVSDDGPVCSPGGGCQAGTSNGMWTAGNYGQCGGYMPGSCWDGSNRARIGNESICCDTSNQCAVGATCFSQGDEWWNGQYEFVCAKPGAQGLPALVVCGDNHVGQVFTIGSQQLCCTSQRRFESMPNSQCP